VEFLVKADALRAAGERLLHVIMLVSQNGESAFGMTARRSRYAFDEADSPGKPQSLTLRTGDTSIELDPRELEQWNSLVAQTAAGVERMNAAVQAYEEALSSLASGRTLDSLSGLGLESLISNVVDHSIKFQKALDSYQTLRASSSLEDAERRFTRVMYAAEAMVQAANGFAHLSRMFFEEKKRRG
jgi:hypothetical protein